MPEVYQVADKTQKIAAEIHRRLKQMALDNEMTLQEATEEILKNGLAERGYGAGEGTDGTDRTRESGESDQGGSSG